MSEFEQKYKQIADTDLWKHLVRKSDELESGMEFVAAVGEICAVGLELSRDIIRLFPTYTLHDIVHCTNVCRWMWLLLGKETEKLTIHEAALLLMSACCHDIGMSVSREQEKKLREPSFSGWKKHFAAYRSDEAECRNAGSITDRILRNYVRQNHHLRIKDHLILLPWPEELTLNEIKRDVLLTLCESHGTYLSLDKLTSCDDYDLMLCAVLLRLADLLDYDAERAPEILFCHMGLNNPETPDEVRSAAEQKKTRAGRFKSTIKDGVIRYNAVFKDLQQEKEVRDYLDWVEQEMDHCRAQLGQTASSWKTLNLPYKISTDGADRDGYEYGEFCMTMDQDKVIDLLAGKHLYSDPGVFVRELLQNSIDAVLLRVKQDSDFRLEDGSIIIDTWPGEAGDTWFRIRDNGIGMDQHIITNYFLKVGRSYYTSEEFCAANCCAPGGKYTAISRFGIGILSCFMMDSDNTELKVSTKRFGSEEENGIRLDVTGLHGYYYLAHEQKHPDCAASFLKMPTMDDLDENWGYRMEPGTTICVKTNLFRMGTLKSFREILDKYVQFPEVRVEYNGPEGHKEYMTQRELMDVVHAMNPGILKDYIYEFSDGEFEYLKKKIPIATWESKPAIAVNFYPIDWLADSEKMTGVAMTVGMRCSATCPELKLTDRDGQEQIVSPEIRRTVSMHGGKTVGVEFDLQGISSLEYPDAEEYQQMRCEMRLNLDAEETSIPLPKHAKVLWDILEKKLSCAEADTELAAYNGVLAVDQLSDPEYPWKSAYVILLLREDYLPEVNMARDEISKLPPEAASSWAMTAHLAGLWNMDVPVSKLTERMLAEMLEVHPVWRKLLSDPRRTEVESTGTRRLIGCLELAANKRRDSISVDFLKEWSLIEPPKYTIMDLQDDGMTADFPIGMFAYPAKAESPLAYLWNEIRIYNRNHPFSEWLIQNRADLEKKLPAVYDTLIHAMVQRRSKKEIRDTVNAILTRLRSFKGNCFGICDDLFLIDADFAGRD